LLSSDLQSQLEKHLQSPILHIQTIGGGDINEAQRLDTAQGHFFVKLNDSSVALDMFEKEAKGLQLLATSGLFKIPKVIATGKVSSKAYLLMEHVDKGLRDRHFWQNFGTALANMHRQTQANFGLDHDNYIGILPQRNQPQNTWTAFYSEQRLQPQLQLALQQNRMTTADEKTFQRLYARLAELCPDEAPALTHGDLWSGNFMSAPPNMPVLIDPAVAYTHREMDLAMTRLFGGFDALFYQTYEEVFPLTKGFEQRLEVYQLYYLMVHVNLFGGSYVQSVRQILKRF